MIILGVHDGHNASAALLVDGVLKGIISEDRLSRQKHHYGFPKRAINLILKQNKIGFKDINHVAMSTKTLQPAYFQTRRNTNFTIEDYWREQREYWFPIIYENKKPSYIDIFSHHINDEDFPYNKKLIAHELDHEGMWRARLEHISHFLQIDPIHVSVHDHHKCHAYYGHLTYSESFKNDVVVLTMDGGGDGLNGTVSIANKGEPLRRISESSNCNIGRIYRYITLLLGMRPADHEYKLMGLSAYNSFEHSQMAYEVFAETLQNEGLGFKYGIKVKDHFFHFKDKLEGMRFDAIAYGLQLHTEILLTTWVKNAIAHTGIKRVVLSGGVSQNIKANKKISEIEGLEDLYIPPGPGDESISAGAAFCSYQIIGDFSAIKPLDNAYFPYKFEREDLLKIILKYVEKYNYTYQELDLHEAAEHLSAGAIIGRFDTEKMEFGARALGNRSIIADPRNSQSIHTINKKVKMRDFWMPFAPSILEERVGDYLVNPKAIKMKYMSIGLDSTDLGKLHLSAGLHPFDRSARPQVVSKNDNPGYWKLIREFECITGVGALLNTSFNIHGEPIVATPEDALSTFSRSGIDILILGNYLIKKA
jgi:carbamoyltransferase